MIIGMYFRQAKIIELALVSAVVSRFMVESIFIIISFCSQLLLAYDPVIM